MKKTLSILLIIMVGFSLQSHAQVEVKDFNKDPKDWKKGGLLANFPGDVDALQNSIREVDVPLADFKKLFDECRRDGKLDSRIKLRKQTESLPILIDKVKRDIQNLSMYPANPPDKGTAISASFLYSYLNAEIEAYLSSLELLKPEVSFLFSIKDKTDHTLNVFDDSNFLIAYYHMAQCRLLLVSGISSLERYFQLGSNSEDIIKRTVELLDTTKSIKSGIRDIQTSIGQTKDIVTSPFKPYYREPKLTRANIDQHDKINGAANEVLRDSRKNWWWRTLVGGLAGGLIAGLLVK